MGTVVISVDAELGWGFHDEPIPADRVAAARPGWRRLLGLFDRYRIPATWAVVGHLFLEECDGIHEDHPAGPRWFCRERTVWADRPDVRFAPDLVARLRESRISHDIGCHSFSHIPFGSSRFGIDVARAELAAAIERAETLGLDLDSFTFPRHSVAYRQLLDEFGFTCYRGSCRGPQGPVEKLLPSRDLASGMVTPTVGPAGLVALPASLYLFGFRGWSRRLLSVLGVDPIVRRARRGIDAVRQSDEVFHLWLQPNNLVTEADVRRVESILRYLDRYRSRVQIATMADVARQVRE